MVDLDDNLNPSSPQDHHQAFTVWLQSANFRSRRARIIQLTRQILAANPFTTLQIVLECKERCSVDDVTHSLPSALLRDLLVACQESTSYLDRYYSMQPGRASGAKRLIVLLPARLHSAMAESWREAIGEYATLVWQTEPGTSLVEEALYDHEYAWQPVSLATPSLAVGS